MIKRNVYLLWGIALLQGMVFYAPVATLYRQAAGLGIFHITLIESISLGLMLCSMVQHNDLTKEDIDELYAILDGMRKE